MTDEELAKKVKAKYPAYASWDDAKLADKVKAKYPVYATSKPTIGQRMKGAASRIGEKIVNKFPFLKGEDTEAESFGMAAGQLAGAPLGIFPSIMGAGAGHVAGTTGLVGPPTKKRLSDFGATALEARYAPKKLKEEMKRSFARGTTFGAGGEAIPLGWKGAKAVGREALSGMSAMAGVGERIGQLKKLPLLEKLKVLMPGSKIPTPEVAGAAQGATEEKLGIPTLKQVTKERVYAEPKPKGKGVGSTGVPLKDIIESLGKGSKGAEYLKQQGLKLPTEVSSKAGESTPVMRRVAKAFQEKGEPVLNDAIQALRDTHFRAGKLAAGAAEGPVYAEETKKINAYLEGKIKELMQARHTTHLAHLRDELLHILPQSPKGEPYRFGVMRLLWLAKAATSVLSGGTMSPWGSGVAATVGEGLTKILNPFFSSATTPAALSYGISKKEGGKHLLPHIILDALLHK